MLPKKKSTTTLRSYLEVLPQLTLDLIIHSLDIADVLALRASSSSLLNFIDSKHQILSPLLAFRKIFLKEYNDIEATLTDDDQEARFQVLQKMDDLCRQVAIECRRWIFWSELITPDDHKSGRYWHFEEDKKAKAMKTAKETASIFNSGKIELIQHEFTGDGENSANLNKFAFVGNDPNKALHVFVTSVSALSTRSSDTCFGVSRIEVESSSPARSEFTSLSRVPQEKESNSDNEDDGNEEKIEKQASMKRIVVYESSSQYFDDYNDDEEDEEGSSRNWMNIDFFTELMKFIGCVPCHWTPAKFVKKVLRMYVDDTRKSHNISFRRSPQPFLPPTYSQAIATFFQSNHSNTQYCSIVASKMTELRTSLRLANIESISSLKPVLEKITPYIRIRNADFICLDAGEYSSGSSLSSSVLITTPEGKEIVSVETEWSDPYGRPSGYSSLKFSDKKLAKVINNDDRFVKLASFEDFESYEMVLMKGSVLFHALQHILESLNLKDVSVEDFAKVLCLCGTWTAIEAAAGPDSDYEETGVKRESYYGSEDKEPYWNIFDEKSYAESESKLREAFKETEELGHREIKRLVRNAAEFIEAAIARGVIVKVETNSYNESYKLAPSK